MERGPRVYWDWTVSVFIGLKSDSVVLVWGFAGRCILPMSPNFLSSNIKKRFLLDISLRPLIVFSEKSSIMSAWVLSTQI